MKDLSKVYAKEQKELAKWKKVMAKPEPKGYLLILAIVVTLIHIVDETITQVGGTIQSNVINEFFVEGMGLTYQEGLSKLSFLSIFSLLVTLLAPIYKTLADRIGRKPLLFMNVLGFAVGMTICFLAYDYITYIIGMCIVSFFTSHDMQVTYILESAPDDKRASFYGVTKGIGTIGCVMLPILRTIFMGDDGSKWRMIFIVPAILGIAISVIVLFVARETTPFLEKRIALLETPIEQRRANKEKEKKEKVGIMVGLKYIFKNKQLRMLLIASLIAQLPTMALSSYYQSIMYLSGMTDAQITTALFAYPFVFGAFNIFGGALADKIGRKPVIIISGVGFSVFFILFALSCTLGWAPFLVGALYAIYMSFYWMLGDFRGVMTNELSPTRIRFSITGASTVVAIASVIVGMVVSSICVGIFENLALFVALFSIPCVLIGTFIVAFTVKETKGTDLNTVEEA